MDGGIGREKSRGYVTFLVLAAMAMNSRDFLKNDTM
jgi:hypothetical protein